VIEIDDEIQSPQYMRNIFQRWFDISEGIAAYDDRVARAHEENGG